MADCEYQMLIRQIYRLFTISDTLESVIEEMAPIVGKAFRVNRLYILTLQPEGTFFEWTDGQTESVRESFEMEKYWTLRAKHRDLFDEDHLMRVHDIKTLPDDFRAFLEDLGVCSSIQCLIMGNDGELGLASLDRCDGPRRWTDGEAESLAHICWILAAATLRHEAVSKAAAAQVEVEKMAYYDPILKLPNRYKCETDLDQAGRRAVEYAEPSAVLMLDINNFHFINDVWGHAYGDLLLQNIVDFLKNWVEPDHLYRLANDEFVLLFAGTSDRQFRAFADKILQRFDESWDLGDQRQSVSVSLGAAYIPEHGTEGAILLQYVHVAIYQAKKQGGNALAFFSDEANREIRNKAAIETKMYSAVRDRCQEFRIFYQPIVESQSGRYTACEALLRWHNPETGFVMPGEFMPLAEQSGLIIPIGEWMLKEAARECKKWEAAGLPNVVSLNLSARQLFHGKTVSAIRDALDANGLQPSSLIVEITESLALKNFSILSTCLNQLREMGVRIAMDDFGVGFSSLANLSMLPLDIIKIDRSVTADVVNVGYKRAFIQTIIHLAHSLGLKVCIEGVETAEQCEWVMHMQSDYMQGYYFNKPVPNASFFDIPSIRLPGAVSLDE
ncbi:MAG: EAL domain-containing protein [Peptococcaceae bacterium]|jgi:diguanylate cyclase (GGDEF)-like protein|nr:EAL domain-containing protein [Peptococcaceae bacterium]